MALCKNYNARTADKAGYVIPVEITVYDDKSFTFILKTPPASVLLLKAAGVEKGSKGPKLEKVGTIIIDKLRAIATEKLSDLNCSSIESTMRIIAGTASNMRVLMLTMVQNIGIWCRIGKSKIGYVLAYRTVSDGYNGKKQDTLKKVWIHKEKLGYLA